MTPRRMPPRRSRPRTDLRRDHNGGVTAVPVHEKKIPLRKCSGCGEMKPKKELIRVVRSPQGEISLDRTGRSPGRGAYVCPDIACLRAARKAKRFERSFSCAIPAEVYDKLEQELMPDET